jgi:acyl-CoA synthetase (NDP forming)
VPINRAGGVIRSIRVAPSVAELEDAPELVVTAVPPAELVEVARDAAERGRRRLSCCCGAKWRMRPIGRASGRSRCWRLSALPGCAWSARTAWGAQHRPPGAPERNPRRFLRAGRASGDLLGVGSDRDRSAPTRRGSTSRVSSFASLGQRADVSTNDLLEMWEEDSRTAVLMLYVKTVGNPERFALIARRVARGKPILAIKGHRRPDPTRGEARSHTGATLRGDAVVDGLLYHGGVQRFRTGEELFNAAQFYDRQTLPLGRQIGIVSNSVGLATLAADACATRGLVVALARGRTANPLVMPIRAIAEIT